MADGEWLDALPDWLSSAQATPARSWNELLGMPQVPEPIVPPRDVAQEKTFPRFVAEAAIPHLISAPFELAGGPARAYRGEMTPEQKLEWGPAMAFGMLAPVKRPFGGFGIGPTRPPRPGEPYGRPQALEAGLGAERGAGEPGGIGSLEEAQRAATQAAGAAEPIEGLPTKPLKIGEEYYVPGPNETIRNAAADYMNSTGRPYFPAKTYADVDVPRAQAIAQAFEDMPHAPNDPKVRASYEAMAKETIDQFRAIERNHPDLKIEFIKPGMEDPYAASPRLANKDLRDNNHLWVFPTDLGFGEKGGAGIEAAKAAARDNPLLQPTDITLDGRRLLVNDVFRIVHDYFGHFKEGHGFRAAGEENAWRSHAAMYSDLARPAMTSETRGQNSWVNFGPHGEKNRTASAADTVFSQQKLGLLPDWAVNEGRGEPAPFPQYTQDYPPMGAPVPTLGERGNIYMAKELTPQAEAFARERSRIIGQMREQGYTPYFDPAKRSYVDPANYPPANVDTLELTPSREATVNEYRKWVDAPQTRKALDAAYKRGQALGNADDWYAMAQFEKEYVKEYGEKEGRQKFLDEFAAPMAATTSGNAPPANFLMAQYLEYNRRRGEPIPTKAYELPVTVGGRYAATNLRDYARMRGGGGYQALGADQPKMHNFARSFLGDLSRAVIDEQMAGGMLAHAPAGFAERARKGGYGTLEAPVHALALRRGVAPGNIQDVAWAGFKGGSEGPMINVINDAIERTHRLTGMPRDEIVRRGLIRKEIPIYSAPAWPMPYALAPAADSNNPNDPGRSLR